MPISQMQIGEMNYHEEVWSPHVLQHDLGPWLSLPFQKTEDVTGWPQTPGMAPK